MSLALNKLVILLCVTFLVGCSSTGRLLTSENFTNDKVAVIGLVEYDYSNLQKDDIEGISLLVGSEESYKKFTLPAKYIERKPYKKHVLLRTLGNKGDYYLFYYRKNNPAKNDDMLATMEQERLTGEEKIILQNYTFGDHKIVNFGKLIVKYKGGQQQVGTNWGTLEYAYDFDADSKDTTALHIFKITYPEIYNKYKNNIFTFKSAVEENLEYVLNHISEGKRLFVLNYLEKHSKQLKQILPNLSEANREDMANKIEKLTFEELEQFLKVE